MFLALLCAARILSNHCYARVCPPQFNVIIVIKYGSWQGQFILALDEYTKKKQPTNKILVKAEEQNIQSRTQTSVAS